MQSTKRYDEASVQCVSWSECSKERACLKSEDAELDEKTKEERFRSIYMHQDQPCPLRPYSLINTCISASCLMHGPILVHYLFCSSVSLNEPHDWSHEPM
jgi:hypothetical protein